VNNEQQTQQTDDPSGPGWRWVCQGEKLELHDMMQADGEWSPTKNAGQTCLKDGMYRRRIEQQQPSDSEPENAELQQLREQVQALTLERDEHARKLEFARESGEMSRRQVECEASKVEQLKEQVTTLTRKLKDANDTYQLCLQNHYKAGQRSAIDKLQAWLRPVLEVVADHPDDTSILAASVLEFLPQIASRLIEE